MRPAELDDPDRQIGDYDHQYDLAVGTSALIYLGGKRHLITAVNPVGPLPFLVGMGFGLLEGAALVGLLVWLF